MDTEIGVTAEGRDGKHDERRDCAEDNRRGDLAAKRILVPRAVKPAHQHGRADAHARYT